MPVADALAAVAVLASPASLDNFRTHLDPLWIEEALRATGTSTIRKRPLPSEQVIWVVLGMAMFRDRSIGDVVAGLDLALGGGSSSTSKSAIAQARKRLGAEPMKWLFETSAAAWSTEAAAAIRWRGLSVYGVDGTSLRVADSPDNRAEFGGQAGRERTESSYPLVRIVTLMALRSHLLRGAVVAPCAGTSELSASEVGRNKPTRSTPPAAGYARCTALPLSPNGRPTRSATPMPEASCAGVQRGCHRWQPEPRSCERRDEQSACVGVDAIDR